MHIAGASEKARQTFDADPRPVVPRAGFFFENNVFAHAWKSLANAAISSI